MKKVWAILCITGLLAGCKGQESLTGGPPSNYKPVPVTPDTVAIIHGQPITMAELQKPLIEGYGLNVLLNLMQLDIAQQTAAKNHITITDADVQNELTMTLDKMFKDNNADRVSAIEDADAKGDKKAAADLRKAMAEDNERLLEQFLQQQHLSRPEFDLVIRTNAYLRKIVEPTMKDAVTDKMIEDGFNFRYGEEVQVRHIQVTTQQALHRVMQSLKDGEDFAQVATEYSENTRTAPSGGLLPPFSRATPLYSDVFKDTAFSLKKPGEVSDPVNTEGSYQIIQLVQDIPPKAVKLADVRDSLKHDLYEAMVANSMKQLRAELVKDALASMKIIDPTLKKQFDDRMFQANKEVKGKEQTLERLNTEREQAEYNQSTQPATQELRPPATKPASVPATSAASRNGQ